MQTETIELLVLSEELLSLEAQMKAMTNDITLLTEINAAIQEDGVDDTLLHLYGNSLNSAGINLTNAEVSQEGIFSGIKKLKDKLVKKQKDYAGKIVIYFTKLRQSIKQSMSNVKNKLDGVANGSMNLKTQTNDHKALVINHKLPLDVILNVAKEYDSELSRTVAAIQDTVTLHHSTYEYVKNYHYIEIIETGDTIEVKNQLHDHIAESITLTSSMSGIFKKSCDEMTSLLHEINNNYINMFISVSKDLKRKIDSMSKNLDRASGDEKKELEKELHIISSRLSKLSILAKYQISNIQQALSDLYSYPVNTNMSRMG